MKRTLKRTRARKNKSSVLVGQNIVARRKTLGISQKIAAERCRIPYEKYIQLEKGIGVFESVIPILKVAEGLGITYEVLFENEQNIRIHNACVPQAVWDGIEKLRVEKKLTVLDVAELVGCSKALYVQCKGGESNISPLRFNNILQIFQLKATDLEKMVTDAKQEEEQKPLPEPKPELVESKDSDREEPALTREDIAKAPEETTQPDEFETRMLKVMRLQKDIDSLMNQTKAIMSIAYDLYKALEKLK